MNNELHYDTAAMRAAAEDIRAKTNSYKAAAAEVETTVQGMAAYWDDEVVRMYTSRYNNELKITTEDLGKLMTAYADFLEQCAEAIEKIIGDGKSKLN